MKEKFEVLYHRESDSVFRYCLFRTTDRETALDLTQEVFVRMWNTLVAGKRPHNERAFLFAIARNLVIDWYRAKKSLSLEKLVTNTEDEENDNEPFFVHDGKDDIEMEADARLLAEKLKALKPMYQQVVYLRFIEEMKPYEIAEVIGVTPNVVSVRITRGLAELRRLYNNGS